MRVRFSRETKAQIISATWIPCGAVLTASRSPSIVIGSLPRFLISHAQLNIPLLSLQLARSPHGEQGAGPHIENAILVQRTIQSALCGAFPATVIFDNSTSQF